MNGIWSAISAVCTGAAVLVAVWATRRVLEQAQKSQLKDELRAVREAQSALLGARGRFKAAIHAYWKAPSASAQDREFDPFSSEEVKQEARVHEAAYGFEAAAWVLIGAIRGASALGARLWDPEQVTRLVDFIDVYGRQGWMPNYLSLVATLEPGQHLSRFSLAWEVAGEGSSDMDALVSEVFGDGDRVSGFPMDRKETSVLTDSFIDAALSQIREAIGAFLEVGDKAAETLKPLRNYRRSRFLSDEAWKQLDVVQPEEANGPISVTALGKEYSGNSREDIISQIWQKGRYGSVAANPPLARGWREARLIALARHENLKVQAAVERGELILSDRQAQILKRLIDGDDVAVPWPHQAFPLTTVNGRRLARRPRNVKVYDATTDAALLQSLGPDAASHVAGAPARG
jgi:hypothetical protein